MNLLNFFYTFKIGIRLSLASLSQRKKDVFNIWRSQARPPAWQLFAGLNLVSQYQQLIMVGPTQIIRSYPSRHR